MNSGAAAVVFAVVFMLVLFSAIASSAETITYGYDNLQRLTGVEYGDGTAVEYVYDYADNRLQESANPAGSTYSISGQILKDGVALEGAVVTLAGAYTSKCFTDANGNYTFTWVPDGVYARTMTPIRPNCT
jgi:YD repeat-containing protein